MGLHAPGYVIIVTHMRAVTRTDTCAPQVYRRALLPFAVLYFASGTAFNRAIRHVALPAGPSFSCQPAACLTMMRAFKRRRQAAAFPIETKPHYYTTPSCQCVFWHANASHWHSHSHSLFIQDVGQSTPTSSAASTAGTAPRGAGMAAR
jgi:hypothetical protein